MLGKFGETMLLDWGLAKPIDRLAEPDPDPSGERPIRSSGAGGSSFTVDGSALGTPPFMSPEQATGRLDLMGPPSDVYSLGATLYNVADRAAAVRPSPRSRDAAPPRRAGPIPARRGR